MLSSTLLSTIEEEKRKHKDTKFDDFNESHILPQDITASNLQSALIIDGNTSQ